MKKKTCNYEIKTDNITLEFPSTILFPFKFGNSHLIIPYITIIVIIIIITNLLLIIIIIVVVVAVAATAAAVIIIIMTVIN